MKEQITSKFDKSKFEIEPMGVEGGIDPYIKDFMLKLNESDDIMTIYSCEGHEEYDQAYLFFNVNEKGWDIFWLGVMPELSERFSIDISKVFEGALYQLQWLVSAKSNEYNSGISINSTFISNEIYTWKNTKEEFWNIIKEVFLKHFK